jgi:hypothetical protein
MKNNKIFCGIFLAVLLLNWGLSALSDRPFRWWITVGLFVGFSVVFHVHSSRKKTTNKGDHSK